MLLDEEPIPAAPLDSPVGNEPTDPVETVAFGTSSSSLDFFKAVAYSLAAVGSIRRRVTSSWAFASPGSGKGVRTQ